MGFRDRAKKVKADYTKSTVKSQQRKDFQAYGSILKRDIIKEKGFDTWYAKAGEHDIDIIPFFPSENLPGLLPTEVDHVIDIWVHKNVGTSNEVFPCESRNYGKDDPMCEYIKANKLPKDQWSEVRSYRQCVYFVWVHDTPEEEVKGVQIWNVAHFFMEESLNIISKLPGGAGGVIPFSCPDNGKRILFTREGGAKDTQYKGHRFFDRTRPIPDKILDRADKFPLDQFVKLHVEYEELEEAFYGRKSKILQIKPDDSEDINEGDSNNPCPAGAVFGESVSTLSDCDVCVVYDDCWSESKNNEPEPEPELDPEPEEKPKRITRRTRSRRNK